MKIKLGGGTSSNTSRNIGDIFYTTRTDNSLNGAVECNGSQYNFSDFDSNLQNLLDEGKLTYVSIGEFDSMVSEKGWCDKIGYGINELTLYPVVHTYDYDGQGVLCYTNILDWSESERDNNGRLLNVKVYDKDTHEEFVGYYVKYSEEDNIWWIYTDDNDYDPLFDLIYPYRNGETITLPTGGEFQITTYFKVPKLSAYIIQKENIPVIGNGISPVLNVPTGQGNIRSINEAYKPLAIGDNSGAGGTATWTTDPTKSGIITDLSNDSFTGRVMIQLFNSTTDTAVATCNQVLADVSALNGQDSVIYWDSYEASDHSHAYSNITLTEHQWYRIYKSGWVEQGGIILNAGVNQHIITIPIEMNNVEELKKGTTVYPIFISGTIQSQGVTVRNNTDSVWSSNTIDCFSWGATIHIKWEVKGYMLSTQS